MTLPKPEIFELKFQKSKRYKRLKILNFSEGKMAVNVDIDATNELKVRVYPVTFTPEEAEAWKE